VTVSTTLGNLAVALAPLRPRATIPRPAPGTRPLRSGAVARTPRCGVLALHGGDRPTWILRRAVAFARALDVQLHVLMVMPRLSGLAALCAGRDVANATRVVENTRSAHEASRVWLSDALESGRTIQRFTIAHGDFLEQAAAYAATVQAALIIVPSEAEHLGKTVRALARATKVPVFVARDAAGRTIVAATDLVNGGFTVLHEAAELGRRVQRSLVAVHNVTPFAMSGVDVAWTLRIPQPATMLDAPAERLASAVARLPLDAQTVVRSETNPSAAILSEAKVRGADFVVVGTRRRDFWDRALTGSVSAHIVNRAPCSVLVVPLAGDPPS
jgi:nucleotide-binding universal stress UspA family protein